MSYLVLPALETLPGWPAVTEPGLFDILLLILIIPLAATAAITLFSMGPHWFRRGVN